MIEIKSILEDDVEAFLSHPEADRDTLVCAVRELAGQLREKQAAYVVRAEASIKAAIEQREAFANGVVIMRGEIEALKSELKKKANC